MNLSVIVPIYNTSKYLVECLNSILVQTYKDFEVIMVDDCSTDNSVSLASRYLSDSRFHLICLKKHTNVTNATKTGIEYAQGEIITIVDSDDRIFPTAFATVMPVFDNKEIGFVWSKYTYGGRAYPWSKPLPRGLSLLQALKSGWWGAAHHKFFRKSVYLQTPGLNTEFDRASDHQLCFLMGLSGCKSVFVPRETYWYRPLRSGSITSQGRIKQKECSKRILRWILTLEKKLTKSRK